MFYYFNSITLTGKDIIHFTIFQQKVKKDESKGDQAVFRIKDLRLKLPTI